MSDTSFFYALRVYPPFFSTINSKNLMKIHVLHGENFLGEFSIKI